jgi:hypothetical protein
MSTCISSMNLSILPTTTRMMKNPWYTVTSISERVDILNDVLAIISADDDSGSNRDNRDQKAAVNNQKKIMEITMEAPPPIKEESEEEQEEDARTRRPKSKAAQHEEYKSRGEEGFRSSSAARPQKGI